MSVVNLSQPHPHLSCLAALAGDLLSESLGAEIDVYVWCDEEWNLELDSGTTSRTHELRTEVFAVPENQKEPIVRDFQDASHGILPIAVSDERLLAVFSDSKQDTESLLRLARLAQQNIRLQLQQQSFEPDSVRTKTNTTVHDAETDNTPTTTPDSSFLQTILQDLSGLQTEHSVSDAAALVLPTVSSAIKAQSIAVVPKSTSSRDAFFSVGDHVGDLAEWERIVESHWEANSDTPVYHRVNGVAYSSIRNFVIAPIRMGQSLFGWLVADIDENDRSSDEQLTLSQMNMAATILATYAFSDERLKQKEQLLLDVVRSLVTAIDAKDPQTCGHSVRVAIYASVVAEGLALTKRECEEVYLSGLLHDVGKIGVPETIFHKTTSLTDEEFELVKQHPDHGWKILHRLEDLQHILPGVVHHHESYDGTGYPDSIAGEDIPLAARILAAVDAYDALTSERPYRKGKSHSEAMFVLSEGAGIQWDPVVIEALQGVSRRLERVSKKYRREAHPWRIPGGIDPHTETNESTTESTAETTSRYDDYGVDRI